MEVKKSVMLVEDDYRLQQELLKLLTVPEDIECLGAVSSAEEAIEKIPAACPDVVLMDINLPGKSGRRRSLRSKPSIRTECTASSSFHPICRVILIMPGPCGAR